MPKLLADFLQEQQEPFALEAYLLERGYSKHITNCSPKYGHTNCADFLRGLFSQFVLDNRRNANVEKRNADEDGFSQASSISLFNSCLENAADCFLEGEIDGDSNLKEESKQLSPISVLDEDSPIHYKDYKFKAQEQHSNSRRNGFQESQKLNPHNQYIINKKALKHGKQLLVDCTREVIENEKKRDEMNEFLGDEDVRKYVWKWSQDCINGSNVVHLLHSEFLASIDEWRSEFEQQKLEILMEIENVILENVINEIIL